MKFQEFTDGEIQRIAEILRVSPEEVRIMLQRAKAMGIRGLQTKESDIIQTQLKALDQIIAKFGGRKAKTNSDVINDFLRDALELSKKGKEQTKPLKVKTKEEQIKSDFYIQFTSKELNGGIEDRRAKSGNSIYDGFTSRYLNGSLM